MARKENSKAKEKKRERKLMEMKMNAGSVLKVMIMLGKVGRVPKDPTNIVPRL